MKKAFTIIELIFVVVILGILTAIAIPKLSGTKTSATIAKGKADIASIRAGIVTERQARLITGSTGWIANGTGSGDIDEGGLFGGILMYPITASTGNNGWSGSDGTYTYKVNGSSNTLTYTPSDGKFLCEPGSECTKLTN